MALLVIIFITMSQLANKARMECCKNIFETFLSWHKHYNCPLTFFNCSYFFYICILCLCLVCTINASGILQSLAEPQIQLCNQFT